MLPLVAPEWTKSPTKPAALKTMIFVRKYFVKENHNIRLERDEEQQQQKGQEESIGHKNNST